jgi:hypothetical protein
MEAETQRLQSVSHTIRQMDVRCVKKVKSVTFTGKLQCIALNLHADTSCVGSNMAVLELTGEKVNVTPFSEHYLAVTDVPIATVATVWKDPRNGELWKLLSTKHYSLDQS